MTAPRQPATATPRRPTRLRLWVALFGELVPIFIIVLIAVAGVRMFFQPYQIVGASMSPALANGERLFVNRGAYSEIHVPGLGDIHPFNSPQRGDIVVLESDHTRRDDAYIKRIIGLPGETVSFTDGIVVIDDKPLVEDYIDGAVSMCVLSRFCSFTVPGGYVYVLGDNRADSEDSRSFGPVPLDDVVGKAFFSNWPANDFGPIANPDYSGT